MSIFSSRLEQLRNQKGWTKTYASKRLGLALTTYANYEYGEREPDFNMLKQIATLFDTSTDYLTGKTNNPASNEKDDPLSGVDLDSILDNVRSYDGKPMDDHDREIIRNLVSAYYMGKDSKDSAKE